MPNNEIFYRKIVSGYLSTTSSEGKVSPKETSTRTLSSKWDGLRAKRVIGSDRVRGMLEGAGDTFDFL